METPHLFASKPFAVLISSCATKHVDTTDADVEDGGAFLLRKRKFFCVRYALVDNLQQVGVLQGSCNPLLVVELLRDWKEQERGQAFTSSTSLMMMHNSAWLSASSRISPAFLLTFILAAWRCDTKCRLCFEKQGFIKHRSRCKH